MEVTTVTGACCRRTGALAYKPMPLTKLSCRERPGGSRRGDSLRQASLCRATKQLMPTPRGRRPPPTPGGGSGLSYYVFRGAMSGRCLASGGGRLRRQGTGREGRGKGGKEGEEKRREEVEWRWLWWVGGKGRREGGEGMFSWWCSGCPRVNVSGFLNRAQTSNLWMNATSSV